MGEARVDEKRQVTRRMIYLSELGVRSKMSFADRRSRLAGYVGRVPRGGSVIPEGGVLHPDDADQSGTSKKRKPKRVSIIVSMRQPIDIRRY